MNASQQLLIALLLCVSASSFAEPGWMRAQGQERPGKQQYAKEMRREAMRSPANRDQTPMQNRRMAKKGEKGEIRSHNYEQPRNNGKMSPEERRVLRRQISEANQTIRYHSSP